MDRSNRNGEGVFGNHASLAANAPELAWVDPPPLGHFVAPQDGRSEAESRSHVAIEAERDRLRAILDAMEAHVCLLDANGKVLMVNRAWRTFAAANGGSEPTLCDGADYLGVCAAATGAHSTGADEVGRGIADVIAGARESYHHEYPCDSPSEARWFSLAVSRCIAADSASVLVVHHDITAIKRGREQAAYGEQLVRQVFEAATDVIVVVDTAWRIVAANPALATMFDHSPPQIVGQHLSALFTPQTHAAILARLQQACANGERLTIGGSGDCMAVRRNGTAFPVEASLARMDAPAPGFMLVVRDISRRIEAEAGLRLLDLAIQASPQAIVICDAQSADLPAVLVNDAFPRMTGYARGEVLGRNLRFLQGDLPQSPDLAVLQRAIRHGESCDVLLHNRRKDGTTYWNQLVVSPIRNGGGTLTHFVGIQSDVTDRENARRALIESETRFRDLAEALPFMVALLDTQGRRTWINRAHRDFLGRDSTGELEATWMEGIEPEDLPGFRATVDEAVSRQVGYSVEYRHKRTDGRYRWLRGQAVPRLDTDGRFLGFAKVTQDIDELHQAESLLGRFNEELEHSVEQRTDSLKKELGRVEGMSNAMVHDLRAPLVRVAGFTRLLLRQHPEQDGSDAQEMGTRIVTAVEKMDRLLIDLSTQIQVRGGVLDKRRLVMGTLVREYVEEACGSPTVARYRWQVSALPDLTADQSLMRLVIQNLIENAIKYSSKVAEPAIEIGPVVSPGEAGFFVRDNGAGFPMAHAGRLFQPLSRLHAERDFPGTGVGLSNVLAIVQKHGGRIWCDARPGAGATFYVALPNDSPPPP